MDYNPPDDFKMTPPMIQLKSSDGEIFDVEVKVAQCFLLIKEMLDDLGVDENDVISIPGNGPEITGAILGKIIQWAKHHKDDPAVAVADEKEEKPTDDISNWDAEFLQVDQSTLFQMIRAANFLNIKGLLDATCKKVAKLIKGMTLEEVRQRLNIHNDFSLEEEEKNRKENAWCEGFSCEENNGKAIDGSLIDKNPAVSVQDVDNEGGPVVEECLKNSVVVRKVLKHFSIPELLKLSTLNNLWNYEARLVMRERGNVVARLLCHSTRPCHQVLEAFTADLQQMNVVPYSGMSFTISRKSHAGGTEALDQVHEVISARLVLKRFSLRLTGKWWDCKDCPALILLKKLLQDFSGVLQELTLDIAEEREEFIDHFGQDCTFSGLKVMKLQEEYGTSEESYTNYMKGLVARAPKLQELHTYGPINLMENVLEGSAAVLMPQQEISLPLNEISENLIDKLRLKDVNLFYTGTEFNLDGFNRMASMLLLAPGTATLRGIHVDYLLAVPLMCYGISLENINQFGIALNYNISEVVHPHLMSILKDFDFTRIFPNLDKVSIYYSFDYVKPSLPHMIEILMHANALLREPLPERAANIKELNLYQKSITTSMIQFFAEMFPDIQKLEITGDTEEDVPFGSIWEHWPDLKELKVTGKMVSNTDNLDSLFCGIFPEEIAELRLKDEDYLKEVHIVPVMPAITCLKNLKDLTLSINKESSEPFVDDGTFMFSKVTEFTAFGRFRSLAVNLELWTHGVAPVSHLKSFASVKCMDLSVNPMEGWEPRDMSAFIQQLQIGMGVDFDSD